MLLLIFSTALSAQEKLETLSFDQLKDSLDACIALRDYQNMMPYATLALQKAELDKADPNYARALYYLGFAHFVNQERPKQGQRLFAQGGRPTRT